MPAELMANPVNALALESSVLSLWQEFLSNYFDGSSHAVGAEAAVDFPLATLAFQQSAVGQPLEGVTGAGVALTVVQSEPTRRRWKTWETVDGAVQERVYQPLAWNVWVRATGKNARALGKLAADRLTGLLNNAGATRALAQKGLHHVSAQPPRIVQDNDYSLRLVSVQGTARYAVRSQAVAGH